MKRAQLLGNVHNICDTCTTSLKRAHIEYLKTLSGGGETRSTHFHLESFSFIYLHIYILYLVTLLISIYIYTNIYIYNLIIINYCYY